MGLVLALFELSAIKRIGILGYYIERTWIFDQHTVPLAVMINNTKSPPEQIAVWILTLATSALIIIAGTTAALGITKILAQPGTPTDLLVSMLQQVSFVVVVPVAIFLQRENWKEIFHFQLPRLKWALIYGGIFIAYIAAMNGLLMLFGRTQSIDAMLPFWYQCTGVFRVLFIINVVLLAPLGEEILFRGYLFGSLSQVRNGVVIGAIVSTAVWTLMHAQYLKPVILWPEIVVLFVMGLLLCLVRHKTQSLWLPVGLHIINNAIGVCVLWVEA